MTRAGLTVRATYWTNPSGASRIRVTFMGRYKSVPFDYSARDAHVTAVLKVTGIALSGDDWTGSTMDRRYRLTCPAPGDNHSSDTLLIYSGSTEPRISCGYHYSREARS